MICGDPTVWFANGTYINHPDHRVVAAAALEAVFWLLANLTSMNILAVDGLTAVKVRKVFVEAWGGGDTWVNTAATIERKSDRAAQTCESDGRREPELMLRQWAAEAGKGKDTDYAETFRVITLVSDEDFAEFQQSEGGL